LVNVSEVMTTKIVAARESTTAMEASTRLLIGNFNGLPVIDSSAKVIGIVTAVDILRTIRQGGNLHTILVIDIMTPNPIVVKHDTDIAHVIDIILQRSVILVPVIDDENRLIGLVGRYDILRHTLNEKFLTIGH
jgi:predicted transcriptional regulator